MANSLTVDEIIELARRLPPDQKLKLIEKLAAEPGSNGVAPGALDDQYQRGYEQIPEQTSDVEALLPHLPLGEERWE